MDVKKKEKLNRKDYWLHKVTKKINLIIFIQNNNMKI